ncbi:MAG: MFS transporter [Nitrososphaerota archaeon]|nr:MFS transporter [Nitrososphaerales archaeon]MCX8191904.1 MFS transporter [Nitrososphaerales archaeon]MDW8044256.1 MFS transporter [Nitrososphaerota archaeon]
MFKELHSNVKILLITSGFLSLSMGITYPFLSEYIYTITGSAVTAGIVASIHNITCICFLILGGFLTDHIGRKKPIWIGTYLLSLSQFLYALADEEFEFFLAAMIEGISCLYFPAFNAMIMDSVGSGRLMSTFTLALIINHLPFTVTSILGGYFRDSYGLLGLRIGFIFGGLITLIIGSIRWRVLSETMESVKYLNIKMLYKPYINVVKDFQRLPDIVKKLVMLRSFVLLIGIFALYYFSILYAVNYANIVSFTEWGLIVSLSSIAYTFALPLTRLVVMIKPPISYSILILCEALTPLLFLLNMKITLFIAMALLNVCSALIYGMERSIVAKMVEQNLRGRSETFMDLSYYFGATIGSLIGGYVYSYSPPFLLIIISSLLMVGAIFGFFIFAKSPKIGGQ